MGSGFASGFSDDTDDRIRRGGVKASRAQASDLSYRASGLRARVADLRVISGKYRGRSLRSPATATTHPMGAREKLALFNMVNVENARVLDAYAGSGALGIEALSRGAREVVFVEKNRQIAEVIRENLRILGVDDAKKRVFGAVAAVKDTANCGVSADGTVDCGASLDARVFAEKLATFAGNPDFAEYFEVIFADPPYDKLDFDELQDLARLLRPKGVLALSTPSELEPIELAGLRFSSTHTYARARITIYRKEG